MLFFPDENLRPANPVHTSTTNFVWHKGSIIVLYPHLGIIGLLLLGHRELMNTSLGRRAMNLKLLAFLNLAANDPAAHEDEETVTVN